MLPPPPPALFQGHGWGYTPKCPAPLQPAHTWRRIPCAFISIWYSCPGCWCSATSLLHSQLQFLKHFQPETLTTQYHRESAHLTQQSHQVRFQSKNMLLPDKICRLRDLTCMEGLSCYWHMTCWCSFLQWCLWGPFVFFTWKPSSIHSDGVCQCNCHGALILLMPYLSWGFPQ